MSHYLVAFENPMRPGERITSGPYWEYSKAAQVAADAIEEWLSVLHEFGDITKRLKARYRRHGERPSIVTTEGVATAFCASVLIHSRAVAWAEGDAADHWSPPHE